MRVMVRWAGIFIVGMVLLAGAAALIGYGLLTKTVTPESGEAPLAGLSGDVVVVRDSHGVPHIEAANRLDALRALGYVHASERLWQMEVLRMAGQGRLSEMFGDKTVPSDRFLKTLNIVDAAKNSETILKPETRQFLQAYADGVNAWVGRKAGSLEPSLPVEFIILGHSPEPWEPWQSLAVLKVMALTLDANMDEEIGRLTLAGKGFTPQQIEDVYPVGPRDTPPNLPDLRLLYGFGQRGKAAEIRGVSYASNVVPAEVPLATAPWQLQLPASNNWAIAGSRTESGKPLLANDPHLGLTAPSVFYLTHMKWQQNGQEFNLIGGSLPGTPLVLSGRSDTLAWGLTTTYLDSQDLFLEQINPEDPNQYKTETGFEGFKSEEVVIKVKGGADIAITRRSTRHGPVLPDGYEKLKERLPDNQVAALSWTALTNDDTTMDGVFAMSVAENVDQFVAATRQMISPMQSIVVADVEGNIGLVAPGRVPKRSPLNDIAGRAPVPGWLPMFGWEGYLRPDEAPSIINPLSGAVATANANWLPADYTNHITYDWAEHFRQDRVEELFIRSNAKQSLATMISGQSDVRSSAMMQFRDLALQEIPQGVLINEQIIEALQNWNGDMRRDDPVPLILNAWHRHLTEAMLKDELGDDFELVEEGNITRILGMLRATNGSDWCNDVSTPDKESCGDILFSSLKAAVNELETTYGKKWQDWRWGTAHITVHEHRPFTQVDLLDPYFTIRQEMDGGKYTLLRNSNNFSKKEPYAGMHGSALRTVYDFADLEKSQFIISTGQSGNVMSGHYDDLAKLWGSMEYIPMVTKADTYRAEPAGVFTLKMDSAPKN